MMSLVIIMTPLGCQPSGAQESDNHPPFTPSVTITPSLPVTGDDLSCVITTPSTDPDGDEATYSYQWYRDEVLQPGLTSNKVPAADTARGEVWRCEVTPNDSFVYGPSAYDEVAITIFDLITNVDNEIPPIISSTEADTKVSFSGTGNVTGTIAVGKYDEEPTFPTITLSGATGKESLKFVDIQVIGFTIGTAHVKVSYTDDELAVAGLIEDGLSLYYWDGNSWVSADNSNVDIDNNIVSGDIPVSALAGTPVAIGGDVPGVPAEAPGTAAGPPDSPGRRRLDVSGPVSVPPPRSPGYRNPLRSSSISVSCGRSRPPVWRYHRGSEQRSPGRSRSVCRRCC